MWLKNMRTKFSFYILTIVLYCYKQMAGAHNYSLDKNVGFIETGYRNYKAETGIAKQSITSQICITK